MIHGNRITRITDIFYSAQHEIEEFVFIEMVDNIELIGVQLLKEDNNFIACGTKWKIRIGIWYSESQGMMLIST